MVDDVDQRILEHHLGGGGLVEPFLGVFLMPDVLDEMCIRDSCNIDHIWASWNKAGGKNPPLTGTFTFADRDGKKVVLEVSKFLDTLTQGYEYDKYLPRPSGSLPFPPANAQVAFALHATSAQTSGPVSLGAAPVTVTLAAAPPAPGAPAPASGNDALTQSLQAVPASRQFILQLNDVKAMSRPGVNYDVYYGLAEGQTPSHDSPAYAGSLSFFGVAPHGDMGQMCIRDRSYFRYFE